MQTLNARSEVETLISVAPTSRQWANQYNTRLPHGQFLALQPRQPVGAARLVQSFRGADAERPAGKVYQTQLSQWSNALAEREQAALQAVGKRQPAQKRPSREAAPLLYINQSFAKGTASYVAQKAPRGYTLSIDILSRYSQESLAGGTAGFATRPLSTYGPSRLGQTVGQAVGDAEGGRGTLSQEQGIESVSFDFGFDSLIVCDSSKIQLQFVAESQHICSSIGAMMLTYSGTAGIRPAAPDGAADPSPDGARAAQDGPPSPRIPFAVSVSDSFNPPESLALGQPWRVTYRISSQDPPPQLWNIGCVGVSPVGGALASLLITSSEPFDLGEILIENHLCAEIAVRLDGDLLFEGVLKNEPGTQNVSLCHGRFLGQPVGISAWDGQVIGLDNGALAPL